MGPDRTDSNAGIRDFLTILFKHWKKSLAVFVVIVGATTIISFVIPPTYEAKSSLLVKMGREFVYQPEVGQTSPHISIGIPNQEEMINSEIGIIKNTDLIRKVITVMGVETLYPGLTRTSDHNGINPVDSAILKFQRNLTVEGIRKSNIIEVRYRHGDPKKAADATNLLIEFYREKHLQVYSPPSSPFLDEQVARYTKKLNDSEDELQAFKQQNQVYSLSEQRTNLLQEIVDIDKSYKETQNKVKELRQKLSVLTNQTKRISESDDYYTPSDRGLAISALQTKLFELQTKEQELLSKYEEGNRLVIDVRREIENAKALLREQEGDIKQMVKTGNPIYQEIEKQRITTEADLKAQEAKEAEIKEQVTRMDREIKNLDLKEKEFQTLNRDVGTDEKNYKTYMEKFQEALISEDLNRKKIANISIVESATVPIRPVLPRKALNIVLSVFCGAVAGLATAFYVEYNSQCMSTAESVERRIALPVLASVPVID
jgi:uncharacterized protein involved in exopolysaccharide biosynthesis